MSNTYLVPLPHSRNAQRIASTLSQADLIALDTEGAALIYTLADIRRPSVATWSPVACVYVALKLQPLVDTLHIGAPVDSGVQGQGWYSGSIVEVLLGGEGSGW